MAINSYVFNKTEYTKVLLAINSYEQINESTTINLSKELGYDLEGKHLSKLLGKLQQHNLITRERRTNGEVGRPRTMITINWGGIEQALFLWCCEGEKRTPPPPPSKSLIIALKGLINCIHNKPRITLNQLFGELFHFTEMISSPPYNTKPPKEWVYYRQAYHQTKLMNTIFKKNK